MNIGAFSGWVMETGLVVSLLILLILLIRRPFARWFGAGATYALWSLPLIRLCLPVITVPESWVPPVFRSQPEQPLSVEVVPAPAAESIFPVEGFQRVGAPEQIAETPILTLGAVLIGIWLAVAVIWFAYQLAQQNAFKARLKRTSSEPSAALMANISSASNIVGLNHAPNVRVSTDNIGPLVTGVLKPLVILPKDFEADFEAEQRSFALVHEFAHIKRHDLWVALAALVFRAINWPNPIVHYAAHRLRADQEAACDAYVVKKTGGHTAHSYAETLVKAVRAGGGSASTAHLALSLAPENRDDDAKDDISKGDLK